MSLYGQEQASKAMLEAEARRMHGTPNMGPVTLPHPLSLGGMPIGTPGSLVQRPVQERIAELSQRLAEAAFNLADARMQWEHASARKVEAESTYSNTAHAIVKAISELQEGTPENVPYGREV